MSKYRSLSTPVAGLIFALLGLIYSVFMGLGVGAEIICVTSGCSVVNDFKLLGVSPWWGAVGVFGLIAVLCIARLRGLAQLVALLFLFGDCLFLILMIFLAPCASCLIVAPLVLLTWVTLRQRPLTLAVPRLLLAGGISLVWFLLFMLNLGQLISEAAPHWSMNFYGQGAVQNASTDASRAEDKAPGITIYFSPSCPACLEAVAVFRDRAAYYPVAESEEDLYAVALLEERHKAGADLLSALRELEAARKDGGQKLPELSLWKDFTLHVRLMRNQSRLTRQDFTALPVIMFEGLPVSWAEARAKAESTAPAAATGAAPAAPALSADSPATPESAPGAAESADQSAGGASSGTEAGEAEGEAKDGAAEDEAQEAPAREGGAAPAAGSEPASPDLPLDLRDSLECGQEKPCP